MAISLLPYTEEHKIKVSKMMDYAFKHTELKQISSLGRAVSWLELLNNKEFLTRIFPKSQHSSIMAVVMAAVYEPKTVEQHPIDYIYEMFDGLPF